MGKDPNLQLRQMQLIYLPGIIPSIPPDRLSLWSFLPPGSTRRIYGAAEVRALAQCRKNWFQSAVWLRPFKKESSVEVS